MRQGFMDSGWPRIWYVAEDDQVLPECLDYPRVPPQPMHVVPGIKPKALSMQGIQHTRWATPAAQEEWFSGESLKIIDIIPFALH